MKRFSLFLLFAFVATTSFAQFSDTAQLNAFIKDTIKDRKPDKITAAQIQKGMLGISKFLLSAPNFATTNLKFTGSRTHNLSGNDLFFDSTRTFIVRTPSVPNGLFQVWDYPAAFTKIVNIGDVGSDTYLNVDNFNSTIQIVSPNVQVNGQNVVTQDRLDDTASVLRTAIANGAQNIYKTDGTITGNYRHVGLANAQLTFDTKRPTPVDWETPGDSLSAYISLADTTDDDVNVKINVAYYESGATPQVANHTFASYGEQHYVNEAGASYSFTTSSVQNSTTQRDTLGSDRFLSSRYQSYASHSLDVAKNDSISATFFVNAGGYYTDQAIIQGWVTNNPWSGTTGNKFTIYKDSTTFSRLAYFDGGVRNNFYSTTNDSSEATRVIMGNNWDTPGDSTVITGRTGYYADWDDYGQSFKVSGYSGGAFYGSVERIHDANAFEIEYSQNPSFSTGLHSTYNFGTSVDFLTFNNGAQKGVFSLSTTSCGATMYGAATSTNGTMFMQSDRVSFGVNTPGVTSNITLQSMNATIGVPGTNTIQFKNTTANSTFATFTPSTGDATLTGKITGASFVTTSTTAPTSTADATGVTGEIRLVGGYLYFKQPSTGWVRTALTTF